VGILVGSTRLFADMTFVLAGSVGVARDENGVPIELMPQSRYVNVGGHALGPHGSGPFCRLVEPALPNRPGVYVLAVDGEPVYIGETANLHARWRHGHGNISPRNCFAGGQPTNCKVNHGILRETLAGHNFHLWVYETTDYKAVETRLLRMLGRPPWNGRL
jgi:hypothetical protein